MINLLIANRNLQNLLNLQNCISQYIPDMRVGYLATNGKEVLEELNNHRYDVVLMDTNLPGLDGFDVLNKLPAINQIEYKKAFIISTNSKTMIRNLNQHDLVFKAFSTREEFGLIIHTLKQFMKAHEGEPAVTCIRNKIINELQTINFNVSHKGTHYLAESIMLMATTEKNNENLSKYIYPKVSIIFGKNLNNIKCNITSATEAACRNLTDDTIKNYFKLSERIKPTTKMIIYSILRKIQ